MFKRETATAVDNGKRAREVFAAQSKDDFKALLERLIDSNLKADELLDVLAHPGIIMPVILVSTIIAARYARTGNNSEDDAIRRGEAARAHHGQPDESYFTKRTMVPAGTDTIYPSDVKRHAS